VARSPLQVGVLELRRRPGTQRDVDITTTVEDVAITAARVPTDGEVHVAATLEAIEGGAVTVTGTVTAPMDAECRRCLEPIRTTIDAGLSEVFEPQPVEGETYPLEGDLVDLEPVVRDALLLALPLAPLCREDCPGPAPEAFPTGPAAPDAEDEVTDDEPPLDPRWAALRELRLDDD